MCTYLHTRSKLIPIQTISECTSETVVGISPSQFMFLYNSWSKEFGFLILKVLCTKAFNVSYGEKYKPRKLEETVTSPFIHICKMKFPFVLCLQVGMYWSHHASAKVPFGKTFLLSIAYWASWLPALLKPTNVILQGAATLALIYQQPWGYWWDLFTNSTYMPMH